MQLAEKNRALLIEWGADPDSQGVDENEGLWRDAAAERLLERYPRDVQTGEYIGISVENESLAKALLSGVTRQEDAKVHKPEHCGRKFFKQLTPGIPGSELFTKKTRAGEV